MSQHGYLKISYHGKRSLVDYKLGGTYDEILERTIQHFKIPYQRKSSLVFTNTFGKIFGKRQFGNYLILQPSPKITFHLRNNKKVTGNKLKTTRKTKEVIRSSSNTGALTQTPKRQKRQRDYDADDDDTEYDPSYPTTPVFRMNCFIGVYPSKCTPPPEKRVRFSEELNSIRIIPARSQVAAARKGVLPRTHAFYDGYNTGKSNADLTLDEYTKQRISESTTTFQVEGSPMTQLACCSPLQRTKSFIHTLPAPQPLIKDLFKKLTRRMLFANAQGLTE